ncbi:hypothetical protein CHELA40_50515 [Chelatococcus asaccharovorans]|nr:hypothetical protein CHELA17_20483 [Chelatococcus asaccharovorans]CAH1693138.1 hypothetical protein CHELA40_50515 [Chelatococcus asaccharovorans]
MAGFALVCEKSGIYNTALKAGAIAMQEEQCRVHVTHKRSCRNLIAIKAFGGVSATLHLALSP